MHSPFPGMDPYLEDPGLWPEFHRRLVELLAQVLRTLVQNERYEVLPAPAGALEIREKVGGRLVTLVEVLVPAHKATGAGREACLERRRLARDAGANRVEIDLLLRGESPLPYSREGLPHWHYAVTVERATHPERYEIYTATVQKRLPRFRLPLAADDRDAVLDLQAAFSRCYVEGGYSDRIDYQGEPAGPLGEEDRGWLYGMLQAEGRRPPHEAVALAAYYLWEREGRPHGRDREHWYRAREQLRQPGSP